MTVVTVWGLLVFFKTIYYTEMTDRVASLLSLIPPSCMVAPSSELANTLFPVNLNTHITPITLNNNQMDMEVDTLRGRSVSSSANGSRESSAHSSVSSIPYVERMEAQSNDPSWVEQVDELCASQGFLLSYTFPKERENNIQDKAMMTNNMPNPQGEGEETLKKLKFF